MKSSPSKDSAEHLRLKLSYATRRTVLPFKYRAIVGQRVHRRDAADRNWFLALSLASTRYVNRATHSFPRQVMASRNLSMFVGSHCIGEQQLAPPADL